MLTHMKRSKKTKSQPKKSNTIISKGFTEADRGGALSLVAEDDVTEVDEVVAEDLPEEEVVDEEIAEYVEPQPADEDEPIVEEDVATEEDDDVAEDQLSEEPSEEIEPEDEDQDDFDEATEEAEPVQPKKRVELKKLNSMLRVPVRSSQDKAREKLTKKSDLDNLFGDDEKVDYTQLERRKSHKGLIALILVGICLLGVAAYMGYSIFKDQYHPSGDATVKISVPEKVASGDVVEIDVSFVNNKTVALKTVDVELVYPQGFHVSTTSPESEDDHYRSFTFADIAPGAGGTVRIVGQLVGATDDQKEFSVVMTYRPSNFSQDFQSQAKDTTVISSSQLSIAVDAPKQVAANEDAKFTFTYSNSATVALEHLQLSMVYPQGFAVSSADPESSREDNTLWTIDALQPQEERTLSVTGKFTGNSGDNKELTFQIGIVEADGTVHPQTSQSVLVVLVNPEFTLEMDVPDVITSTESIDLKTVIKNSADVDMQDIDVSWEVIGPVEGEKTWAEHYKKIQGLQSKEATHTITLDADKEKDESVRIIATITKASLNGNEIALDTSVEKVVKIRSNPSMQFFGAYYDTNLKKIGSGPIPPQVGETTTYSIQYEINTSRNDISALLCSVAIPDDVTFIPGDTEVEFDEVSRLATWKLATLKSQKSFAIEFGVSITPVASDVDHLKVLTEKAVCEAQNTFTEEKINEELKRVTTDLTEDDAATGKGVVVE